MVFLPRQLDLHQVHTVKFYCGVTCLYFPLLTISILCTDIMYETGKYSFIPILCLIALFEIIKYVFISYSCKEAEKHSNRHAYKGNPNSLKRFFTEKKLKEIVKGMFLFSVITAGYFVIAVLFGAELFRKHEETLMVSALLGVLTALPPCLHLGPNAALSAVLGDDANSSNPLSPVLQHVVRITLLGSWLGAFVIPLDWDRPWQKWPVPCCVGALMGYVAAHTTAMIEVALSQNAGKIKASC